MTNADLQAGNLDHLDDDFVALVVCYLEGELTPSQRERLKAFLAEDAGNRDAFVTLCFHASLLTACVDVGAAEAGLSPVAESARPGIAGPGALGLLGDTWHSTVRYFSVGGPLVCLMYLVTILLFGLGLLAGSLVLVTPRAELAERSGPPPAMAPVGVITRMSDCQWADRHINVNCGSVVALGAKFDLVAGLLEITYNNGEKVAIRGRATYEVDSHNSGFLSLGKLAARSDQRSDVANWPTPRAQEGAQSEVSANGYRPSPNPRAPVSSPFFSVRTPTIIVTDRGAIFGVDVEPSGVNQANVLCGNVELRFANGLGPHPQVIPLGAYESARLEELGALRTASVLRYPVRLQPSACPAPMPGSAAERTSGSAAQSQGPQLTQVISAVAVPNKGARGSLWTCGDTFPLSLKSMVPGTVQLRVTFTAHNYVKAIRFNGKNLPVPRRADHDTTDQFGELSISEGLVEGQNSLQIDVAETSPSPTGSSPLTLQLQFGGYIVPHERRDSAEVSPRGGAKQEKKQPKMSPVGRIQRGKDVSSDATRLVLTLYVAAIATVVTRRS